MSFRILLAALLIALASAPNVEANGRFPATVNVHDRPDDDQMLLLPVTFGLLMTKDNGASFRWVCEDAIGYGGTFDPDYAIAADGAIWATTFSGLKVSRDGGCVWSEIGAPLENQWVGDVEIGPDGTVWAATSSGGMPNDVFASKDGGATFASMGLFDDTAWWKSLRVAPGDAKRIYVTGYLVSQDLPDGGMGGPAALLRRSVDGGDTWEELPVADFAFGSQPQLFIEAVSPSDPDIVFARVLGAVSPLGDAIYRSTDGGQSWERVLEMGDTISAFIVRADGDTVIAASVGRCAEDPMDATKGCVRISTDGGVNWAAAAQEPKMACLTERSDGVLFACGANWEPDNFALGRSTDGQTWEKVFRFSEMAGPLSCPAGTVQFDVCEALNWPSIAEQFGVGATDGPPDAGPKVKDASEGSCGGCNTSVALALLVLPPWRRRRSA